MGKAVIKVTGRIGDITAFYLSLSMRKFIPDRRTLTMPGCSTLNLKSGSRNTPGEIRAKVNS
jgi:hypothetical protein